MGQDQSTAAEGVNYAIVSENGINYAIAYPETEINRTCAPYYSTCTSCCDINSGCNCDKICGGNDARWPTENGYDAEKGCSYAHNPPACSAVAPCGLIFDIHGWGMSGAMQNANDDMRDLGKSAGYIVVHPDAPLRPSIFDGLSLKHAWQPNDDHSKLLAFMLALASNPYVDSNRVHLAGFSQGGFATWNLLCGASDLICSAAPLAASGLDVWGVGYGAQCFQQEGPHFHRSVLYTTGASDPLARVAQAREQRENVKRAYGMSGDGEKIAGDGYVSTTWANSPCSAAVFTYIEHAYRGR
jgi:poly(3-hydroxybutyrate) depolymerase